MAAKTKNFKLPKDTSGHVPLQETVDALLADYDKRVYALQQSGGGTGPSTFVFEQAQAAPTWTIEHFMSRFPSVTVVDSSGSLCQGALQYIDENTVTINFSAPFAGKAFLN